MMVKQMLERCKLYGDVNAPVLINKKIGTLYSTFTFSETSTWPHWLRNLKVTRERISMQVDFCFDNWQLAMKWYK